jgi:hypothetical protein
VKDIKNLKTILESQKHGLCKDDLDEFTWQDAAFHMELALERWKRVLVEVLPTIWGMPPSGSAARSG